MKTLASYFRLLSMLQLLECTTFCQQFYTSRYTKFLSYQSATGLHKLSVSIGYKNHNDDVLWRNLSSTLIYTVEKYLVKCTNRMTANEKFTTSKRRENDGEKMVDRNAWSITVPTKFIDLSIFEATGHIFGVLSHSQSFKTLSTDDYSTSSKQLR